MRAKVRAEVIERDKGCRAKGVIPGHWCGGLPDRSILEVHELARRGSNPGSHLDPDLCIAVCPVAHDWITEHPTKAEALGLSLRHNRG